MDIDPRPWIFEVDDEDPRQVLDLVLDDLRFIIAEGHSLNAAALEKVNQAYALLDTAQALTTEKHH